MTDVTTYQQFHIFDEGKAVKRHAYDASARLEHAENALPQASENDDFSFWDFLDIINPLQHIPVVNVLYREMTGDEIGNTARIIGGTLYGGIGGAATAVANAIIDDASGKDVGEHIMVAVLGEDEVPQNMPIPEETPADIMVADAKSIESADLENIDDMHPVVQIYARKYVDHQGNLYTPKQAQDATNHTPSSQRNRFAPETEKTLVMAQMDTTPQTAQKNPPQSYAERVLSQYN